MAMAQGAPALSAIREHYDSLAGLYLRHWGEHLHHGCFDRSRDPCAAQVRLVERLAERARLRRGSRVLDVGCGLGGSARWLAERLGCSVVGLTISPVQAALALRLTRERGLRHVLFAVADAARLALRPGRFDAVWIIECSEHLADRAGFLAACAALLRPGRPLALCAWMATDDPGPRDVTLLAGIERAMLCPALGSQREYLAWLAAAGLRVRVCEDLSADVLPTWDHCEAAMGAPSMRAWLAFQPPAVRRFVASFGRMREALAGGAMRYGLLVADRLDGSASPVVTEA